MAKQKRSINPPRRATGDPDSVFAADSPATRPASGACESNLVHSMPSRGVALAIAVGVVVHFAAIASTFLSTVSASQTQSGFIRLVRPYIAFFHFDADGVPLHFSTNAKAEKTHVLQQVIVKKVEVGTDTDSQVVSDLEKDWESVPDPGLIGGDRQRRWQRLLSLLAQLGDNEQTALAACIAEPLSMMNPAASQLRVVREPDLMTNVVDDAAAPPYTVAIIRAERGAVKLVRIPPARLAAKAKAP